MTNLTFKTDKQTPVATYYLLNKSNIVIMRPNTAKQASLMPLDIKAGEYFIYRKTASGGAMYLGHEYTLKDAKDVVDSVVDLYGLN